jgi:hypothetical protein
VSQAAAAALGGHPHTHVNNACLTASMHANALTTTRRQARIEAFGQLGAGGPAPPNPHADSLAADLGTAVAPGGVLEGDGCALYLAGVVASDG